MVLRHRDGGLSAYQQKVVNNVGLRCSFTPDEMGFPLEVTEYASDGTEVTVEVDYSMACAVFVDTFKDISQALVPVDTGYLRSTLKAWSDDFEVTAETICEYAQYVEYGTWKQSAQPYFEPAIEQAWILYCEEAMIAMEEAWAQVMDEIEMIEEALDAEIDRMMNGIGMNMGIGPGARMGGRAGGMMGAMAGAILDWGYMTGGLLGELVLGGIGLAIFFPIALFMYGVQDALGIGTGSSLSLQRDAMRDRERGGGGGGYSGGGGGMPFIEII